MVPRPAATVMLVRPDVAQGVAVYMLRRSGRSRFMPHAYVFPGGAVDAADRELAEASAPPGTSGLFAPELAVAALRELFEEAGILLAVASDGTQRNYDPLTLAELRAELNGGAPFVRLLERHQLQLDTAALTYYSNWITPASEPIRFDAHFFIARAPEDQIAAADAVEVHDGLWIAPREALERSARGEMTIIFPTFKHLERLARFDDIEALMAHARERAIKPVEPFERSRGEFTFSDGDGDW